MLMQYSSVSHAYSIAPQGVLRKALPGVRHLTHALQSSISAEVTLQFNENLEPQRGVYMVTYMYRARGA